jgi:hypothetical protein
VIVNGRFPKLIRVDIPELHLPEEILQVMPGNIHRTPRAVAAIHMHENPWLKPCGGCSVTRACSKTDTDCSPRGNDNSSPYREECRVNPVVRIIAASDATPVAELGEDLNRRSLPVIDPADRILRAGPTRTLVCCLRDAKRGTVDLAELPGLA